MDTATHQADLILAQEACDELRTGNKEAILGIYNQYHPFFLGYTRRRMQAFDSDRITSVLTDFWVELTNAKAICDFLGLSSLKTYLFKILNFRIVDSVRRANRQSAPSKNISDRDHDLDAIESDTVTPEKDLMHKEKIKLVHQTLLMLSESSPTDAYLVKMHLEGMDYGQMAEKMLGKNNPSPKHLKKKINSIKKQFTRKRTGSLAKFKSCLERIMIKNQLVYADVLN